MVDRVWYRCQKSVSDGCRDISRAIEPILLAIFSYNQTTSNSGNDGVETSEPGVEVCV